ncbi:MAG: histidinol phosphatase [Anaerolinea sp.]|nr:histidinol phosphatase [Anaerolinea sp.]
MTDQINAFIADLHVHTVLSPCAEAEMIPPLIVEFALDLGIQLIAITDHNSTANISAVQKAAEKYPLTVLPGIELQTREDVHSLCLFDTLEQANKLQELVNRTLPKIMNQPEHFGEQFVVDAAGDFIRRENQLLLTSSSMSLSEAWKAVSELGGLFIPAHIDRKVFSLIENLGLVPTDINIEAFEISKHIDPALASSIYPQISGYPLVQNGDVHRLDEFSRRMSLHIFYPAICEIKLALSNSQGRFISFTDGMI